MQRTVVPCLVNCCTGGYHAQNHLQFWCLSCLAVGKNCVTETKNGDRPMQSQQQAGIKEKEEQTTTEVNQKGP